MLQEFVQQIKNTVRENLRDVHTAIPGRIVEFDAATGLATVQPVAKFKKPNGVWISYPQLFGVPVLFPQAAGQGACIAFPVKAGDGCLLIVSEQPLDYWMYGRETDTDLNFDLTSAVCIPGLYGTASQTVAAACQNDAVILKSGSTSVSVGSNGKVKITAQEVEITGNLKVDGTIINE